MCGPVCVSFIVGLEDEQGAARSRPLDDQCESAETRASQFKVQGGGHPWKIVFKGNIWICHQTLHSEISSMLLICYVTCYLYNKLFNFLQRRLFIWTYHCACEVTQRITTGSVIPRGNPSERPHKFNDFSCWQISSPTKSNWHLIQMNNSMNRINDISVADPAAG